MSHIFWCIRKVKVKVMSDSLPTHVIYSPWNSPGQITGVGSLSLLQGIVPTQGSNPGLLHCRQILYQLSHKGSPSILEWVAYPFSSGSSRPRNQTRVSYTAGRFFTNWATREAKWKTPNKTTQLSLSWTCDPQKLWETIKGLLFNPKWECGVLTTGPQGKYST